MTTRFDNSLLSSTYCTTRALLRHVHGLTTERDEQKTRAGRAAHEALAAFLKGGTVAASMEVFRVLYEEAAPKELGNRLSYENTSAILNYWMQTHPLDSLPFEVLPELVEVPFEIPLSGECVCGHDDSKHDGNCQEEDINLEARTVWHCGCEGYQPAFLFTGRIDAIVSDHTTGKLVVLDHKTTGKIDSSQFRNDSQMSGYVWASRQTGHEVSGAYINALQFSPLPGMKGNGQYKCRVHREAVCTEAKDGVLRWKERAAVYDECRLQHCTFEMPLKTRSPEQLEVWRLTALGMARRYAEASSKYPTVKDIADAPQEGTFYYQGCRFCPFSDFCASGRPVEWMESMFVYAPWSPLI